MRSYVLVVTKEVIEKYVVDAENLDEAIEKIRMGDVPVEEYLGSSFSDNDVAVRSDEPADGDEDE